MFPGKGGMVAPGMTCQFIVQFFPDCLGDFDDFILVETQSAHTLLIPLQARRAPPVLTCECVLCPPWDAVQVDKSLEDPSASRGPLWQLMTWSSQAGASGS